MKNQKRSITIYNQRRPLFLAERSRKPYADKEYIDVLIFNRLSEPNKASLTMHQARKIGQWLIAVTEERKEEG